MVIGDWQMAMMPMRMQPIAKTRAALDAGMDMIDTAAIYGYPNFGFAEDIFGQALKANPSMRDEMLLATKGGIIPPTPYDSSKAHLIETCEASLKRLNTDVIDLFYVHRPDWLTPHQEVAEALTALQQSGKVKEVAVSNYTPTHLKRWINYWVAGCWSRIKSNSRPSVRIQYGMVRSMCAKNIRQPLWHGAL